MRRLSAVCASATHSIVLLEAHSSVLHDPVVRLEILNTEEEAEGRRAEMRAKSATGVMRSIDPLLFFCCFA